MEMNEAKAIAKSLKDQSACHREVCVAIKDTSTQVAATRKLWREGNKSRLIKIGMALIVFPEPTPISESVGACFVAAGAIQKGIQSRSIYMEDVLKNLKSALKETNATKYNLQI